MKLKISTILIVLVLTVAFNKCFSQAGVNDTTKIRKCYWGSVGIGGSTSGFSASINANAELSNRWIIAANVQGEGPLFGNGNQVAEVNVFAGKILKQKFSFFTLSAGLGYVSIANVTNSFNFNSPSVTTYRSTMGVAVSIQGFLVGFQTLGIGLSGYVNLNTIQSTAGINICVALGRLSTHKRKNVGN